MLTQEPSRRIVATARCESFDGDTLMPETVKEGLLARWSRELMAVLYAAMLAIVFYFFPKWDPIANANGKQGALIVCAFLFVYLFYLIWQSWPLVRGEVGAAFSQTTDAIFSSLPIVPVMLALAFHMGGYYEQSFTNLIVATTTIGVVAFDIVVFGGIGALVNRLTLDMHGAGRRGLV